MDTSVHGVSEVKDLLLRLHRDFTKSGAPGLDSETSVRCFNRPCIMDLMKNSCAPLLVTFLSFTFCTLAPAQQIAFTWDDLPAHSALPQGETRVEIGHKLIAAMKAAHMPPIYGFVNGVAIDREPASAPMLKDWRDAGFFLGNHTWSHMNLNTSSLADWEADLLKNEPTLEQNAGNTDWHWLRYPFLAEGDTEEKRTATRKFLAAHGYESPPSP